MIDALPTPPASTSPTTFAADMDLFLAALPTFRSQANALAATMDAVAGGGAVSLPYSFSSTTTDADPGAGYLRLSSATQNASTVIRADLTGSDGSDLTGVLALLDDSTSSNKGYLKLQHATDGTKWLVFAVASVASPSGYRNITATCVASSAASPFTNGDSLLFDFTPTGDKGDKGDTGATGSTGSPAPLGSITPSVGATVDFLTTFSGTYDNYLIIGDGITFGTDEGLNMRLAVSGSADTGSNYLSNDFDNTERTATATSMQISGAASIRSAGKGCNFVIRVLNANDTSRHKMVTSEILWNSTVAGPGYTATHRSFAYLAANAVTGFRLFSTIGGNFAVTGKIRVYGYSNT